MSVCLCLCVYMSTCIRMCVDDWHHLQRFRRYGFLKGIISLMVGFKKLKPCTISSGSFYSVIAIWNMSSLVVITAVVPTAMPVLPQQFEYLSLWNKKSPPKRNCSSINWLGHVFLLEQQKNNFTLASIALKCEPHSRTISGTFSFMHRV